MIALHRAVNSRASSVGRMTSRSDVVRVVRITDELFREQEHVLIIVNELLRTVCVVERDQVCKRSHVRLAQRLQIVDRKSTRLNSSHEWISYAVFCLKK